MLIWSKTKGDRRAISSSQVLVCRLPGSDRQSLTLRAGYAASRISSNLNGRTSKFGWLQARATIQIMQKLRTWRAIRFRPVVHTEVHNSDV
jgi:hypothetical protein